MKFGHLRPGDLFRTHKGTLCVKLANGTSVDVSTWEILPFTFDAKVTWKGHLVINETLPKVA